MCEDIRKKWIDDYKNGKGITKIGNKYHTDPRKVKKYLFENGIDINKSYDSENGKHKRPSGFWGNKKNVENVAKVCRNKSELYAKYNGAALSANKNGWMDELSEKYFTDKPNFPSLEIPVHCVYSYEIEECKNVYVGRTNDIKRRHKTHLNPRDNDTIFNFCKERGIQIPEPKILIKDIDGYKSQEQEKFWCDYYIENGWKLLNKQGVGLNKSSMGATTPKWTYLACKAESIGCKYKEDFKKKNGSAYNSARKNGWLDEFFPNNKIKRKGALDTLDACKNEALKYNSLSQLRKEYPFLYQKIVKNKWSEIIKEHIGDNIEKRKEIKLKEDISKYYKLNSYTTIKLSKLNKIEKKIYNYINELNNCNIIIDNNSEINKFLILRDDINKIIFNVVNVNGVIKDKNIKPCLFSKYLECGNNIGYKVFTIYDSELINSYDLISRIIFREYNLVNLINIDYRTCKIYEITTSVANKFLNDNHVSGGASSTVYLGAYHNNELVSVMCFRNGSLRHSGWEINRFSVRNDIVVDGIEKLFFEYFKEKYSPNDVISYIDRRWGVGGDNFLTNIGFIRESITALNFKYVSIKEKYPELHDKFKFSKSILIKTYGFSNDMTEREMADNLGYYKIWDCGLLKYKWINNYGEC